MKLDGPILHFDQFYKTDGTDRLIAHTQKRVYVYNTDRGAFDIDISDGDFSGGEDDFWTSDIMNDLYIFCNGVDNIKKWDMITPQVANLGGATNYRAKKILKFAERINFYHTVESGTRYPRRVRWGVAGNPEDFEGTGSGAADLEGVMGVDWIQTAEKLGNMVVIYGERSIVSQEYKGDYTNPFCFYTKVSGVGLAAPRALVNLGDEHIFLGWDNVYSYEGGREVKVVGDEIYDELFSTLDPAKIHVSFMFYVEELKLIFLFYQIPGESWPTKFFTYDVEDKVWSKGSRTATGFGYYERKTTITWDGMKGSWDSQTGKWDDRQRQELAPLTIVGDEHGVVHVLDEGTVNVDGKATQSWWESKDFVFEDGGGKRSITNWMEFNFEGRGDKVAVSYSTDGGRSWSTPREFILTDEWKHYNYDIDVNSEMIRFRFSNFEASSNWEIRNFEIGYIPSTDRSV